MKENFKCWEDAELVISETLEKYRAKSRLLTPLLFRGQPNSKWELNTTLERVSDVSQYSVKEYHGILRLIINEASSWRKEKWEIEEFTDFPKDFPDSAIQQISQISQKTYSFMTYLRHHGFPSPLLDWSQSPYVAAYFAFRNIAPEVEHVSIFIFQALVGEEIIEYGKPMIIQMGPNVQAHPRHFVQQCEYTLCIKEIAGNYFYVPYQLVFNEENWKDKLVELILPAKERSKVMRRLKLMNINSSSLFQNEDGFIQGLAERAFLEQE